MSLDNYRIKINDAMKIARQYYDKETYDHAIRVAGYVADNEAIPSVFREDCVCLAVMHDLLEDTDYNPTGLPPSFKEALKLLTKPKEISYKDYCRSLQCYHGTSEKICAYFVKLADMKDHLMLKETLTDKLKEKYLEGLAELL